jgi:hypothetical protein
LRIKFALKLKEGALGGFLQLSVNNSGDPLIFNERTNYSMDARRTAVSVMVRTSEFQPGQE